MVDDGRYNLLSLPRFIGTARIDRNGWDTEIPAAFPVGPEPSTTGLTPSPSESGLAETGFKSMSSSGLSFLSHGDTRGKGKGSESGPGEVGPAFKPRQPSKPSDVRMASSVCQIVCLGYCILTRGKPAHCSCCCVDCLLKRLCQRDSHTFWVVTGLD